MKILIVDSYYPAFIQNVYEQEPDLATRPYAEQWRALMDRSFGTADYYSANLRRLGHEAGEIVYNCLPLQRQWAREHGVRLGRSIPHLTRRQVRGIALPALTWQNDWLREILVAQVKDWRPDVLLFQNVRLLAPVWSDVRPYTRLIAGQHATVLPPAQQLAGFDLLLSSLPNVVAYCRDQGLQAEYFRLGFEGSLLDRLPARPELRYGVVHVGGYGAIHEERNKLLEEVARAVDVAFWGYGLDGLAPDSPIRRGYRGEAWGLDMYRVRQASRIVLSKHINAVAGPWANIMTLYEATGVGSLLLIDERQDLADMFEPGKEVVAYQSPADCVDKIRYYLAHEDERAAVARAGQARTLREHTYRCRMQQLVDILGSRLRERQAGVSMAAGGRRRPEPRERRPVSPADRGRGMTLVRAVARRVLPLRVRRWLGPRLLGSAQRGVPASAGYEVVTGPAAQEQHNAWLDPVVAERQDLAFAPLLEAMYRGEPRADFVALAEAVRRTGSENASILEVGCGSGWNGRVLAHLLGHAVAYSGLDYSPAMVSLGRRHYPGTPFLVGDATRLPVAAGAVEIALSGTVLMHVLDYRAAIRETRRAVRRWCIFHTVPVLASRETTVLRKLAYGGPVLEVVFNEGALMEEFRASGLAVRHVLDSIPYNLAAVLGEPTVTKTYVCEAL